MQKISPFLWFDHQAEEAAALYTSVFPNSKVTEVQRYGAGGPGPEGAVMVVREEDRWFLQSDPVNSAFVEEERNDRESDIATIRAHQQGPLGISDLHVLRREEKIALARLVFINQRNTGAAALLLSCDPACGAARPAR